MKEFVCTKTSRAYYMTSMLGVPFWAIYNLLRFILYKDLGATPTQVALFIAIDPIVSLLSIYWSGWVSNRSDRLKGNILWASFLGYLPFLFIPFVSSPWYFLFAAGVYRALARGVLPAWMETLKLNIEGIERKKVFSYASSISFVGGGILSLLIGWLLDSYLQVWRWIFPLTAFVGMTAIIFQARMPLPSSPMQNTQTSPRLKEILVKPWQKVWHLLVTRPDFAGFQMAFMLGGFGLIVVQPALPLFFVDILNLSYEELSVAIILCKGIAFALSSKQWAQWMHEVNIYRFSAFVTLLACIFPLMLMAGLWNLLFIYGAYLVYGVMQGGSNLSWHMSGPLFAENEDSSDYSSVNVAMVGLRGIIAVFLGNLLVTGLGPVAVLLTGMMFSLAATVLMFAQEKQYAPCLK